MERSPDLTQLSKLAQTEDGKQLLSLLLQSGGDRLQSAAAMAAQGDLSGAGALLAPLLSDPQAQALLERLEKQL